MPLAVVIRLRIHLTHSSHRCITASPHHRIKGSLTGSLSFYLACPRLQHWACSSLSLRERVGVRGILHFQPSERLTSNATNDNFVDLVQIPVKTIFSLFTFPHKIAKRQSPPRLGVMPAIIAIPLVKGCRLGTVTQGR
jgi:hypothetical protein